jgi:uridylate kinase
MAKSKLTIIALGGSIMYPDEIDPVRGREGPQRASASNGIDVAYLKNFKKFILGYIKKGHRFLIITGGGKISRVYQAAAGKIAQVTDEDKDWIGIHATRLNAHLLWTIFLEVADPVVVDSRYKIKKIKYPVTIASGWRPGWSTDYIAVALAEDFGADRVIIAGKPSHVFDKDFTKHKDAKPFKELTWKNYRQLIPDKWVPGFHSPVDPVGAKLAEKIGTKAIVINGKDLKNFAKVIEDKEFVGTTII